MKARALRETTRGKGQGFPDTRWSMVGRAGMGEDTTRMRAMTELLEIYTPALRAMLRGSRQVPEVMVDDLIQGFVADKILARELVARADQSKGRFRSFLAKSLSNYVTNCLKRDHNRSARLTEAEIEDIEDPKGWKNTASFDYEWIQVVVRQALDSMRLECEVDGRTDLWNIFRVRVVDPLLYGNDPVGYDILVKQIGIATPRQGINLLVTAKRRFVKHLRSAVGCYVIGDDRIDNEIAALRGIIQS